MTSLASKCWFWAWHIFASLALLFANEHLKIFSLPCDQEIQRASAGIIAQIGATMMGFVLALVGILASLSSARIIRNMQRSGHFNVLLALLLITAFVYGLLTICGVVISITKPIENYYFRFLDFLACGRFFYYLIA
jgi:heme/copper-type cytochrome/quinol oxidase subunit 2